MIPGVVATVDWAAATGPALTVTPAVCVSPVPFTVAETVFPSATVELSAPVATPFPSVAAAGWVNVLPLPVAASTTVIPATGFPEASFAVIVIVVGPPPAVMLAGAAATVDRVAETAPVVTVTAAVWVSAVPLAGAAVTVDTVPEAAPGVTVTTTVCVTASPFAVAETVFPSATVELNVPVATPLPSVTAGGCVTVFPLPVAASTTVAPLTAFPDP